MKHNCLVQSMVKNQRLIWAWIVCSPAYSYTVQVQASSQKSSILFVISIESYEKLCHVQVAAKMNFQFSPKKNNEKFTRERLMRNQKSFGFNQVSRIWEKFSFNFHIQSYVSIFLYGGSHLQILINTTTKNNPYIW